MNSLKSCRVLVTPTSFSKGDPTIQQELESLVGDVIYNQTGRRISYG